MCFWGLLRLWYDGWALGCCVRTGDHATVRLFAVVTFWRYLVLAFRLPGRLLCLLIDLVGRHAPHQIASNESIISLGRQLFWKKVNCEFSVNSDVQLTIIVFKCARGSRFALVIPSFMTINLVMLSYYIIWHNNYIIPWVAKHYFSHRLTKFWLVWLIGVIFMSNGLLFYQFGDILQRILPKDFGAKELNERVCFLCVLWKWYFLSRK